MKITIDWIKGNKTEEKIIKMLKVYRKFALQVMKLKEEVEDDDEAFSKAFTEFCKMTEGDGSIALDLNFDEFSDDDVAELLQSLSV